MSQIPQQAIDWLMTDTDESKKRAFDSKFGSGQADQVINELNQPVQPKQSMASAVVSDVGTGLTESFEAISRGLLEGGINNPADFLASTFGDIQVGFTDEDGNFKPRIEVLSAEEYRRRTDAGEQTFLARLGDMDAESTTGGIIYEGSKFTGAFVGIGKLFKFGKGFTGAATQGAAADFFGFKGDEGRLTDFMVEMGVPEPLIIDYLKSDADDSEFEGRFKNALEGAGIGFALEGVMRLMRGAKNGDVKEIDEALDDIKNDTTQAVDADYAARKAEIEADAQGQLELFGADEVPPANPKIEEAIVSPDRPDFKIRLTPGQSAKIRAAAQNIDSENADIGWRNRDKIETTDEVFDEIAAVRSVLTDEFEVIRGKGTQSFDTVRRQATLAVNRMARIAGEDPKKLYDRFKTLDVDSPQLAGEILARDRFLLTVEEDIVRLAKLIDDGDIEGVVNAGFKDIQEVELAFMQRQELAANILAEVQGLRTNIARALNAYKITRQASPSLRATIGKSPDMFNFRTGVKDAAKAVSDAAKRGDKASPVSTAQKATSAVRKLADDVNTYRINALLSGPGTQEVNMISNVLNTLLIPTEQMLGGIATLNVRAVEHGARTFIGIFGGLVDALKSAAKAGWDDASILDPMNTKFDVQDVQPKTVIGKLVNMPSRFLLTADEFFKQAAYRGRVVADAAFEARQKGKAGDKKFIDTYIANAYDSTGAAKYGEALLQAQRSTFTEKLDGKLSLLLQQAAISNPMVRFVIPFVRTPLNILSVGFQHLPAVGLMSKRFRDDLAAGGPRRAQAVGKQVLGTALVTMTAVAVAQGRITGSGPKDPRVRKVWLQTNKPYSIRTKNADGTVEFTPYQRYDPYSTPIAITADLYELLAETTDPDQKRELEDLATGLVLAVAENTVNKTFTKGLADALSIIIEPERKGSKALESFAGSFVPNVFYQMNTDQAFREIRDYTDAVNSRLGMVDGIDPKRNAMGEVIFREGAKWDPLGLIVKDVREDKPLDKELTRLAMQNREGFGLPTSRIGGEDLKDVMHPNGEQSLYDRWMELSGTVKIGGKTMREELERFISSDYYARLPDGDADYQGGNLYQIKRIIRRYREAAKRDLRREAPNFIELENNDRRMKVQKRRPRSLKEMVTN